MGTFRMFTTLSNILVGIAALLCIPFQIEGLRKKHYHLPKWIVILLYIGTVGVALTFFISITTISIAKGFVDTMFYRSNIFLHTINPIFAIVLFTFINCDHKIEFKKSYLTFIPVLIYALLYTIMVFFIGEDNGGWRDVYKLNAYSPWPITFAIMFLIVLGIANLLRFLHNKKYIHTENCIIKYYQLSPDFDKKSIEDAISVLAQKQTIKSKDTIQIPVKIFEILKQRYKSNQTIDQLATMYIKALPK